MKTRSLVVLGALFACPSLAFASSVTTSDLDTVQDMAFDSHLSMDFEAAQAYIGDPANGMYDFDSDAAIHVWVATDNGVVIYDHSLQTDAGGDLSTFVLDDGTPLSDLLFGSSRENPDGGSIFIDFPHPVTEAVSPAYVSCRLWAEEGLQICSTAWNVSEG